MAPVLGVEGGGSHTHAVVVDTSGALLGLGANDEPANWEDVGLEAAGASIRSCVREAVDAAGVGPADLRASVLALAGIDFPIDEDRLSGLQTSLGLADPFRICNDAFAALRAGSDEAVGVVVVAGTGSVVAGRSIRGEEFRTLGMGPTFGDSGSASEVSEAAVTAVAHAFTGRGPETTLTDTLCARTGMRSVVEFLEGASRGRIDTSVFARDVVRAAEDGDDAARAILAEAGRALGDTAAHVVRRLKMSDETFDLVLAGGMFRAGSAPLQQAFEDAVLPYAPSARFCRLGEPPVTGAALLALELSGETPAPDVRTRLADAIASTLGHTS